MKNSLDYFVRCLDADRPFFRLSGFDGPKDPLLSLTGPAGNWSFWTDKDGTSSRIEWDEEGPYCEAGDDVRRLRAEEVTMRKLDPEAFASAVGRALGCTAACRALVPGRLFDLGPSSINLGRFKRRVVLAVRLGPLDAGTLQAVPPGKEVLLLVGGSRLERPAGDLGDRTFALSELALGFRDGAFDLDLAPVMKRFGGREGAVRHKPHKNRMLTVRRIKKVLADYWKNLKRLHQDGRYKERDAAIAAMSVKLLVELTQRSSSTLYEVLQVKNHTMECDDPQIKYLWTACTSLDGFLSSLKIGTDIGGFVSAALKTVARFEPEEKAPDPDDRPL